MDNEQTTKISDRFAISAKTKGKINFIINVIKIIAIVAVVAVSIKKLIGKLRK